jgi:signal transduction histidine kinase
VSGTRGDSYRSWLIGELVLAAVLAVGTAGVLLVSGLHVEPDPPARLAANTAIAIVAAIVAVLGLVRFQVDGRSFHLFLAAGFAVVSAGTVVFDLVPLIQGDLPSAAETWGSLAADLGAAALIALAAFVSLALGDRRRAMIVTGAGTAVVLTAAWSVGHAAAALLPLVDVDGGRAAGPALAYATLSLLSLTAAVGFGLRFRSHGRDLDRWLALALTLVVFADLHYVLTTSPYLLYNDSLRLLAYAILLVGAWQAYGHAELGRAVAEERARVARDIHDGLAQYLFAIAANVSMLEGGKELDEVLPRLKHAAEAAQQEARFAVLALSSASGTAPFDSALRRYVELLTGDGRLDVELELDPSVRLAPDEQIEIFRIVQEGLANARTHAGARRVEVTIGHRGGRRVVIVSDDGVGFEHDDDDGVGQGLRNMRVRAASIDGGFSLRSRPGSGTAIEVVLRPV